MSSAGEDSLNCSSSSIKTDKSLDNLVPAIQASLDDDPFSLIEKEAKMKITEELRLPIPKKKKKKFK